MKISRNYLGFTLIEILFAVVLIGVCFFPIFVLFNLSHRMSASSKNLNIATRLANNLMSGVKTVNSHKLVDMTKISEADLKGELDLVGIGVQPSTTGFYRMLTIESVTDPVRSTSFKQIYVDVAWKSSFNNEEMIYRLSTLVADQ